jgi:hypothetical protein
MQLRAIHREMNGNVDVSGFLFEASRKSPLRDYLAALSLDESKA